jgi:hypothetical protein
MHGYRDVYLKIQILLELCKLAGGRLGEKLAIQITIRNLPRLQKLKPNVQMGFWLG